VLYFIEAIPDPIGDYINTDEGTNRCAGQPYFISDWEPINNFLFFRPLLDLYGYSYPTLQLPVTLMFYLALCIEFTHRYATAADC